MIIGSTIYEERKEEEEKMFRQFTHSLSFSFRAHRYRAYLSLAKRGRKKKVK